MVGIEFGDRCSPPIGRSADSLVGSVSKRNQNLCYRKAAQGFADRMGRPYRSVLISTPPPMNYLPGSASLDPGLPLARE